MIMKLCSFLLSLLFIPVWLRWQKHERQTNLKLPEIVSCDCGQPGA